MPKRTTFPTDRTMITELESLPNVGKATAGDFRLLGIHRPSDIIGRDAFALYDELCARTGVKHDACCIDVFMAAVDFMSGAPAAPWWLYTPERKRLIARRAFGA